MKRRSNLKRVSNEDDSHSEGQSADMPSALIVNPMPDEAAEYTQLSNANFTSEHIDCLSLSSGGRYQLLNEDDFLDLIPANSYFH